MVAYVIEPLRGSQLLRVLVNVYGADAVLSQLSPEGAAFGRWIVDDHSVTLVRGSGPRWDIGDLTGGRRAAA